jgi:tetratricopeptide (TPR) repeat protein
MEFGLKLDPASPIISRDLAVMYYFKRDFDAAREQAQQTIDQEPHFYGAYWIMGLVWEQKPDFDQAIACFHRAIELVPHNPRMLSALGRSLALAGRKKEARKVLQELDELAVSRYVSPLDPALIQFGLEDNEQAFERLNRLLEYRCFDLIHLLVDPRFDPLRGNPRFASLVARLGLP